MQTIQEIINAHGDFSHDGDPEGVTREWEKYFQNPQEVDAWLRSRCYKPICAHQFKQRGITPEEASIVVIFNSVLDTIGFHVSSKVMDYEEAEELLLITPSF
jgi:hypothetical protein